mgnify:FL=1
MECITEFAVITDVSIKLLPKYIGIIFLEIRRLQVFKMDIISEMPTPEVENAADFWGTNLLLGQSLLKAFTSPCIICPMSPIYIVPTIDSNNYTTAY